MRACQSIYTESLARPCRDHWKETGEIAKARWREGIESRLKKTRAPLSDPLSGILYPFPLLLRQTNGLPPIFLPSPARPTSDVYYNDARGALSETPIFFSPVRAKRKGLSICAANVLLQYCTWTLASPPFRFLWGKKANYCYFSYLLWPAAWRQTPWRQPFCAARSGAAPGAPFPQRLKLNSQQAICQTKAKQKPNVSLPGSVLLPSLAGTRDSSAALCTLQPLTGAALDSSSLVAPMETPGASGAISTRMN